MPKMALGFSGLDVRLKVCVKEGKSSLWNMEIEGVCEGRQKLSVEYGRRRLLTWE